MGVVVFNPAMFTARYPEFAQVRTITLNAYFQEATIYLSNEDNSPVCNLNTRALFLNMLTAHVAYLAGALSADGRPLPVGRVSQAAEGSVSAALDYVEATPGSGAWFNQTPYGAAFWQATRSLRGMRYVVNPVPMQFNGYRVP